MPFSAGEPIREARLIKANGSGYMAAILPAGMRAISTEISPETGAGGFILPNDHVDVILSRRDKAAEKSAGSEVVISETILTNVRVLAIDQTVEDKNGQKVVVGKTATLELTPASGGNAGACRGRSAPLSLALRSIADDNERQRRRRRRQRIAPRHQYGPLRRDHHQRRRNDFEQRKSRYGDEDRGDEDAYRHRVVCGIDRRRRQSPTFGSASASDPQVPVIQVVGSDASSRFVPLGIGKSVVIDLPRDVKDVLVADPKIANAVVRSSRRAYMIGVKVGQTNIFFFDADGQQIAGFDIAVKRDLNGMRAAIKQTLPNARYPRGRRRRRHHADRHAASPGRGAAGLRLASRIWRAAEPVGFGGGGGNDTKVINSITVHGRDQVMLKVTVAEVQRDVIKQLGIDLSGSVSLRHRGAQFQHHQSVLGVRPGA